MTTNAKLKPFALRTNFAWVFMGGVFYSLFQWMTLIVLAKVGNPTMVGQLTLAYAVTAPMVMFASLRLRLVVATDTHRVYAFGDYLALRILTTTLAFFTIIAVILISGYRTETALVIFFVGVAKCAEAFADVYYGLFQQRERMNHIAFSVTLRGFLGLVALATTAILTKDIVLSALAFSIAWIIANLVYDLPKARYIQLNTESNNPYDNTIRPRWQPDLQKKLLITTLPLGIAALFVSLTPNIPRYVIESSLGEAELGIFGSMAYFLSAGNLFVGAIGQSSASRIATYYNDKRWRNFYKLLLMQLGILALIGAAAPICAALMGEFVLNLVYGPEYAARNDLFILMMAAAGFVYVGGFLGYVFTSIGYFRSELAMTIVTAICTGIASFILVPEYGLKGAAYTLMVLGLVRLVISIGIFAYNERDTIFGIGGAPQPAVTQSSTD